MSKYCTYCKNEFALEDNNHCYKHKDIKDIRSYKFVCRLSKKNSQQKMKLKNSFKIKMREYYKKYRADNKEELAEKRRVYQSNRLKNDLNFRIMRVLRTRLYKSLSGYYKLTSAVKDLGCTVEELKLHLEKLFKPGMNWDNWGYGMAKWHIDHIKPLSKFNLENRDEQIKAVHYTNLQPLWQEDNMKKGNKYEGKS